LISMPLVNVKELSATQLEVFFPDTLVREFTEAYYNGTASVRRRLQLNDDITSVETTVVNVKQDPQSDVNTLTYSQGVSYIPLTDNPPTAREVINGFFDDDESNRAFVAALKEDPDFAGMPDTVGITIPSSDSGDDGLSAGAIAGIAVGGAFGALLLGYGGYKMMSGKDDGSYIQSTSQPPNQFDLNESEDVSTMDPAKMGEGGSMAEYGDQRYVGMAQTGQW